jgi:cytochrome c-type biogenesis protein CcmE
MRRLRVVLPLAAIAASLAWVGTRGLSGNLVYYRTPTELLREGPGAVGERVRLGGLVVPGSVVERGRVVRFLVTDRTTRMTVVATAGVPALFRDGKGVVVEGALGRDGAFHADTVLVRHADSYRPPAPGETPTSARLQGG